MTDQKQCEVAGAGLKKLLWTQLKKDELVMVGANLRENPLPIHNSSTTHAKEFRRGTAPHREDPVPGGGVLGINH